MQSPETNTSETKEKIESSQTSGEARIAAVDALASAFHDEWRQTRLNKDGDYEPHFKATADKEWAAKHGTDQVDIANTMYADLPADWQSENKAAAEFIVDDISASNKLPDLNDPETRQEVGEDVHEAWLARNTWAKGTELDVPFEQLSKEEQEKDLEEVEVAEEVFTH